MQPSLSSMQKLHRPLTKSSHRPSALKFLERRHPHGLPHAPIPSILLLPPYRESSDQYSTAEPPLRWDMFGEVRLSQIPRPFPSRHNEALTFFLHYRFTKTGKFRLHITALDIIAPHARYKVWVKPNGEMPFLYGGNIVKAHVGRWSEDCPEHQGVVVLKMDDTPLVSTIVSWSITS